ncbi:hypothetical protein D3C87_2183460 [compost metagenome]
MLWPVPFQSFTNASRPDLVSGWSASLKITAGGMVATSAPASAASVMWLGVRMEAARISVEKA